jgi:Fic family protein
MKPYKPQTLPIKVIKWDAHVQNIADANSELSRYDGMMFNIVNPRLLLSPLTTQEAVLSSKIEGSQATLDEVFKYEAKPTKDINAWKMDDIQEVINYRKAIMTAYDKLQNQTLNLELIKDIHSILLSNSVRGQTKKPGEIRDEQNYIGPIGAGIKNATYVPPSPDMLIPALQNWEQYIDSKEKDKLVQLAIIKAQFEIIHPFFDGNGRVGRIIIPLFLYQSKKLQSPMFYLSSYLESHRTEYYRRLNMITQKGEWNEWIEFFLKAIQQQAKDNIKKIQSIIQLYEKSKTDISTIVKSQYNIQALDALFQQPIFSSTHFTKISGIPNKTAQRIIEKLNESKIISMYISPKGSAPGVYEFKELLKIIN